ncbi:hypothetical protein BDFG_08561, partial [Blastomyces dermatitidis ATCC 26199]
KPEKSLITETVTIRSSICSFSLTAYLSSALNTTKLSLQNSAVSLSSLCKKALIQSLISIITYLHHTKQLKKRRILYICLSSHFYYFHCICNNDFYLSV